MRNKKAKAMRRIAYQMFMHSDGKTSEKTIRKNMKKTYREAKNK